MLIRVFVRYFTKKFSVISRTAPNYGALNHDNFCSEFWTAKYHDHDKNYADQSTKSGQPSFSEFVLNYMKKSDCGITDQNKISA